MPAITLLLITGLFQTQLPPSDVENKINDLHSQLKVRFETFDDGVFGITRMPVFYMHQVPGKSRWEGKRAPKPTAQERSIVDELASKKVVVRLFTVGLSGRVRGPLEVGLRGSAAEEQAKAAPVGKAALSSKSFTSTTSQGNTRYFGRVIFSTSEACSKCHEGVKKGNPIGAVVYATQQK